jgi:hypothetical protein
MTALTAACTGAPCNLAARALVTAAGWTTSTSTVGASTIDIARSTDYDGAAVNTAAVALLTAADANHDFGASTVAASTVKIAKGQTVDTVAHMVAVLNVAAFTTAYGVTVAADGTTGVVITAVEATFTATGPARMLAAVNVAAITTVYGVTVALNGVTGIRITAVAATFATGQAVAILALAAAIADDKINETRSNRGLIATKTALLVTAMSET